jgi:predicted enzyme related to lactoylglutathione lyase
MGYYAYFKDTEGNILGLWQTDPSAGGSAPAE